MSLALLFQLNLADAGEVPSNSSPTDIALSNTTISAGAGLNAVVATLSCTDADVGDTHTYTLIAGTGDTHNSSFNISGSTLRCNDPATLGAGSYSIRIQADDGTSTPYAEVFTITITAVTSVFADFVINSRSLRCPVITDKRMVQGATRRVRINFSNAANRLQTALSSASWSLQRGSDLVSVGSTLVSGDSAYATITAQSNITGRCVVKVTATMADGQTVTEHIRLTVIKVDA